MCFFLYQPTKTLIFISYLPSSNQSTKIRKIKHRFSEHTPQVEKIFQCDKQRSESFPNPNTTVTVKYPTAPSPESSTPDCPYTGTISKLMDPTGTMSQDSGINMYFQDPDDPNRLRSVSSETPTDR